MEETDARVARFGPFRYEFAAGRLVRPGGEVWTVFNSHLDHRRALAAEVGPTEQVRRTPKFTVTRSVRV